MCCYNGFRRIQEETIMASYHVKSISTINMHLGPTIGVATRETTRR